jgi:hypothetical protein
MAISAKVGGSKVPTYRPTEVAITVGPNATTNPSEAKMRKRKWQRSSNRLMAFSLLLRRLFAAGSSIFPYYPLLLANGYYGADS